MRFIALMIAGLGAVMSGPANAAWQTYENEPLGYSVMFPAGPREGTGIYRSDLVPNGRTHYTTAQADGGTFTVLVIETGRVEDGAIVMGEFEYWLGHFGDIVLNTISRLNAGMEYGRFITLDCRDGVVSDGPNQTARARQIFADAAEIACPEGARMTVNMFFTQGRLYAVTGIQAGENAKVSGAPSRFANSLAWIGANLEHAETLVDWSARAQGAAGD